MTTSAAGLSWARAPVQATPSKTGKARYDAAKRFMPVRQCPEAKIPCRQTQPGAPMTKRVAVPALLALLAASCAQLPAPISQARIGEILSSPDRRETDRTTDLRRKPAQMLEFIGVRPGMVVLDLSAGG